MRKVFEEELVQWAGTIKHRFMLQVFQKKWIPGSLTVAPGHNHNSDGEERENEM